MRQTLLIVANASFSFLVNKAQIPLDTDTTRHVRVYNAHTALPQVRHSLGDVISSKQQRMRFVIINDSFVILSCILLQLVPMTVLLDPTPKTLSTSFGVKVV